MQRLQTSLAEARNGASHLQDSLNRLHEGHHFRKDYQRLLESANSLLKQIEQAQHHAPDVVSQALRKLHTANGCLAKALREERGSPPSLLGTIGSIGALAPVHTESFRTAERLLLEALEELRNPGPIGDSSSSIHSMERPGTPLGAAEQMVQPSFTTSTAPSSTLAAQQQAAEAAAPEQTGLLTQYTGNLGSMLGSIGAMALGPGPAGSVGNLCVAVNYTSSAQLDLYVGCRERQLRSHSIEKQQRQQGVRCITYDPSSSTVWTGHADGSVKVHRIKQAATEAAETECCVASDMCRHGVAVTCLVMEAQDSPAAQPRCWAGDAEGRVCVRKVVTLQSGQLHLLVNATVAPWENQPRPPKYLPVGAMMQLGSQMLVSGGCVREGAEPAHRLQLWDCRKMKSLREFSCRCGPVTCLELLGDVLQPPSAAMESVPSWRSSISEGDTGSGSYSLGCRLLSGHADGQVVLWELTGRGAAPELKELAVIGEYSKDRVVKGIFPFPQWDMLVVATSSSGMLNLGKLRVMHLPTPADLESAERKLRQATAAPHRIAQPTVNLQVYVHEAHTQKILATAHLGETIVTASTSSIKFWSPRQLALYASKGGTRSGLVFSRTGSSGSRRLSDTAGLAEALASSSSSDPQQSPFVRTQQLQQPQQAQQQPQQPQQQFSPQAAARPAHAQPVDIPVGPPSVQPRPSRAHEFVRIEPQGTLPGHSQAGSAPASQGSYPGPHSGLHGTFAYMSPPAASGPPSGGSGGVVPHIPPLGVPGSGFGPFGAAAAGAAGGMGAVGAAAGPSPPAAAGAGAPGWAGGAPMPSTVGPFGAASAGAGVAAVPSAAISAGWAGAAPMSSAQGPMSPVPVPFGVSPPPMSPARPGGVPPWQSPAPTRPLSPLEWQQQELFQRQQQAGQQWQQQDALQRQQQEQKQPQQQELLRRRLQQRLTSSAAPQQQQQGPMGAARSSVPRGSAALAELPSAQKGDASAAAGKSADVAIPSPQKSAGGAPEKLSSQEETSRKAAAAAASSSTWTSSSNRESSSGWESSSTSDAAGKAAASSTCSSAVPPVVPEYPEKQDVSAVLKLRQREQAEDERSQMAKQWEVDAPAIAQAEVAAHCGYQFVRQLPDQAMFGGSRALQVRCSRTNRLRTLLQVPRSDLTDLSGDLTGFSAFKQQLLDASTVHHPHMLQVQEVFVGPLHLNIVLEECSAGRLLDYPAKQASAWGSGPGGAAAAAPAALSPDFARWFFQQAVLAVHYYHRCFSRTDGGETQHHSKLSVVSTLLKIAPTLPQPVVKVPTTILACGISAFTLAGGPGAIQPGDNPFIPPEAYRSIRDGAARPDTPAGDVWACGVLLLKLLGGQLRTSTAYPTAGSSSSSQGGRDVFEFPGQQHSSLDEGARALLGRMLQPRPQERITLDQLRQDAWFIKGLPPNAHTMTERFLTARRACRQSEDELRAAVDAAAAGPEAAMQLLQQLQPRQRRAPAAQQQQQQGHKALLQQPQLELLQGPVTPEQQHGLQLQLHALRHACLQLYGVSTAGLQGGSSSSATRLTELLVAQQAAASAVSAFTAMDSAARALQQQSRLQQAKLAPLSQARQQQDRGLGMAQLLQLSCTDALYKISRLQQLLQGTSEPFLWHMLQSSVPDRGKAGAAGKLDPVAWERRAHLLKLQDFLLVQAHGVLRSLWVCRAAAAAVTRACLGRQRAAAHEPGPQPHLLTAVLGLSVPIALVAAFAAQAAAAAPQRLASFTALQQQHLGAADDLELELQQWGDPLHKDARAAKLQQQRLQRLQGFSRLAGVSLLLLVQLNEAGLSQQQQWQRGRVPVQSVSCLEDVQGVRVSKTPLPDQHRYSGCGSSCTVYEGVLPQQGGQRVLVVALSQLFAPDVAADLPPRRREAREQRVQGSSVTEVPKSIECPICKDAMVDAVNVADGYAYCRACIQKHITQLQAQGREVVSPSTGKQLSDTNLVSSNHLRGSVEDWHYHQQQQLKQVKARVQQDLKRQQLFWARASADQPQEFSATEHLGLAHAAQAGSAEAVQGLQQVLVRLQRAKLLAGSNSAAAGSASASSSSSAGSSQVLPLLAPIHCVCSDPPLLVVPKPEGGTLEQWIGATAGSIDTAGGKDFGLAWVQQVSWPLGLQLLSDVAAALCALHQQQPAVVHGGVHAAAVHLPQQLPDAGLAQQQQLQLGAPGGARVCQLSLVALLSQLAPLSSCHPFLAAPETLLASGPATPAADVYGFGVLMFQLATGWLPQQYTAGTDEQIAAVMWCREMMAQAGSTSPLAAAQALAKPPADGSDASSLHTGEWTPYGRHLPSVAALQQLPLGYVNLMEQCLQRVAPARPCVQELAARLADMVAAGQEQPAGQSMMVEAMRAVEKRRASGALHGPAPVAVPRGYAPSQVSPTRC